MDYNTRTILFILILFTPSLFAQRSAPGGGPAPTHQSTACLSNDQREMIHSWLEENISKLRKEGKIPVSPDRSAVLFQFPLEWNTGFDDYGFYGISNFVDHNKEYPGFIGDYNCGTRSYDTGSGYNHQGIDYFLWPFAWHLVEEKAVKVVAAAPGMIIGKEDGHEHFSCSFSSEEWNAVFLRHDDGSFSWYGHMQKNSLTTKSIGESVEAGEYLGLVGSSGNSTAPHLHFEVYDSNSLLIDPYAGECNELNPDSWWAQQPSYYDPAVNKIQTHTAPPDFNICPEVEDIYASDDFIPGELIYFVTYFKDQQSSDLCQFSIIQPNEQVYDEWTFYQPQSYFAASYWYWSYVLPQDALDGMWTFQCDFAGKTYTHHFTIHNDVSSVENSSQVWDTFNIYNESGQLTIDLNVAFPFDGLFTLHDIAGKTLFSITYELHAGANKILIPRAQVARGVYALTLTSPKYGAHETRTLFLN